MAFLSRKFLIKFSAFFLLLISVCIAIAVYFWFSFQSWLMTPLNIENKDGYAFELESGKTLSHLAFDLSERHLLTHPRWLAWYARYQHKEKVHVGEYLFEQGITPSILLEKLYRGDIVLHQVTFLEGWSFKQIVAALSDQLDIQHTLQGKDINDQLAMLNLPINYPEGWFYPDTYRFSKGTSDVEILLQSYKKMRHTLTELWAARAEKLPYKNEYEALIMASIVEKETGSADERTQIAGVFIRRLQLGMKLQTDPTVIYGMGEAYTGKITKSDLTTPTAYNTYVVDGLPPTPIASPSKASIEAALHPDASKALYFVAKGNGTSEFSDTLAEHQQAVTKYQLQRRNDYRSAPK